MKESDFFFFVDELQSWLLFSSASLIFALLSSKPGVVLFKKIIFSNLGALRENT